MGDDPHAKPPGWTPEHPFQIDEQTGKAVWPDSEPTRLVRIRFVDEAGAGVEGVKAQANFDAPNRTSFPWLIVSEEDGRVEQRVPQALSKMTLQVTDFEWDGRQILEEVLTGDEVDIEVRVERLVTISLDVTYDDGLAFEGRASARPTIVATGRDSVVTVEAVKPTRTGPGGEIFGAGFVITKRPHLLKGIKCRDVTFAFTVTRAGYNDYRAAVPAADIFEGATVFVVIPKPEKPNGQLTLVLPERPGLGENRWSVDLHAEGLGPTHTLQISLNDVGENLRWTDARMRPGTYLVTVLTPTGVWSKRVEVRPGEECVETVELQRGALAEVTILDDTGQPLPGGVIHTRRGKHVDYPGVAVAGRQGISGTTGVATLGGLHASVESLVVEAQGFEPQEVPVALVPGESVNLGMVRLVPAEGKVTIRLTNARDNAQYVVGLMHPYARGGRQSTLRPLTGGGELVFERQPLRDYVAFTYYAAGGRVVSQQVKLTRDQKEVVIELDVSTMPPPRD